MDDGSSAWEKSVADCFYSDGTMTVKYLIPKTIIVHGDHGSQMTSDTQHTARHTPNPKREYIRVRLHSNRSVTISTIRRLAAHSNRWTKLRIKIFSGTENPLLYSSV